MMTTIHSKDDGDLEEEGPMANVRNEIYFEGTAIKTANPERRVKGVVQILKSTTKNESSEIQLFSH